MNEQLLLEHIRVGGELSRAELARLSRLSKPTVSLALSNLERAGLVRVSGVRTGVPGPAAVLYEVRPDAGFVLSLDIGSESCVARSAISPVLCAHDRPSRCRRRPVTGWWPNWASWRESSTPTPA